MDPAEEEQPDPDPEPIIVKMLKYHPRFNPLVRLGKKKYDKVKFKDIRFDFRIGQRGLFVHVQFGNINTEHRGLELRTLDGLHHIDEVYTVETVVAMPITPFLSMTNTPLGDVLPYRNAPQEFALLHFPYNSEGMILYDFNWLWTHVIPDLDAQGAPVRHVNGRFFNVWMTIGDDEDPIRYPALNVCLARQRITFDVQELPGGFLTSGVCRFHLRAGDANGGTTFLVRDVRLLNWQEQDDVHMAGDASFSCTFEKNSLHVDCTQVLDVQDYILDTFKTFVYPHETAIVSVGDNIAPLEFCTKVAEHLDMIVQIMFKDRVVRVGFNAETGWTLSNVAWNTATFLKLPMISLRGTIAITHMKRLHVLENIPMQERTQEQWTEIMRLVELLRYAQKYTNIQCSICDAPAKLQSEGDYIPYCSEKCAYSVKRLK